ncbi:MAG: HD domain-containing protein [Oscillospiraceae bacterium]|nr:HD domain-containing protein [Oscillospiraceae bacterium]
MDRINAILSHPLFTDSLRHIEIAERDREFCKHDLEHFLAVARIANILFYGELYDTKNHGLLKEQSEIQSTSNIDFTDTNDDFDDENRDNKEIIYAAALLHDTGRWKQYDDGTPHEEESARIAELILPECGFNDSEIKEILELILTHREYESESFNLAPLLYRADKLSRLCFVCSAKEKCNWEVKNETLRY